MKKVEKIPGNSGCVFESERLIFVVVIVVLKIRMDVLRIYHLMKGWISPYMDQVQLTTIHRNFKLYPRHFTAIQGHADIPSYL
jgi:hypothetical protein